MTCAWQKGREARYQRWNRRRGTEGIQDTWSCNLNPRAKENLIPGERSGAGVVQGKRLSPGTRTSQLAAETVGWGFTSMGLTREPRWWLAYWYRTLHLISGTVSDIAARDGRDKTRRPAVEVGRGLWVHTAGWYSMPAHSFVISPWL